MIGQMLAYDKHMNLVLGDCEEFRLVKKKKAKGCVRALLLSPFPSGGLTLMYSSTAVDEEETHQEMKRTLGLVILRGETIVSISIEGGPPTATEDKATVRGHLVFPS